MKNIRFEDNGIAFIEILGSADDAYLIELGRKINKIDLIRGSCFVIKIINNKLKKYILCVIEDVYKQITSKDWEEIISRA